MPKPTTGDPPTGLVIEFCVIPCWKSILADTVDVQDITE